MQSIHWIPREQAASKSLSEKICAYTRMSEKVGPYMYQWRKIGPVIYFLSKKGGQSYTWQRWKTGPFGMHICTMPYKGSYPSNPLSPLPPPPPPTHPLPSLVWTLTFIDLAKLHIKYDFGKVTYKYQRLVPSSFTQEDFSSFFQIWVCKTNDPWGRVILTLGL